MSALVRRLGTAVGIPALICAVWYAALDVRLGEHGERNAMLAAKVAEYEAKTSQIRTLPEKKERYLRHLRIWEQLRLQRPPQFTALLAELSRELPPDMHLGAVSLRERRAELQGQVRSAAAAEPLVFAWAASPLIEHYEMRVGTAADPAAERSVHADLQLVRRPGTGAAAP